jgi:hypothetical protein
MATPEMAKALFELKVGVSLTGGYELYKMSKEQYVKFRYYFIEERMYHPILL